MEFFMQLLRKGAYGPEVLELQKQLIAAGYPLTIDSRFGDETDNALRSYQRKHGLVPDGVAGPITRQAMTTGGKPGVALAVPTLNRLIVLLGGTVISAALKARHLPSVSSNGRSHRPVHLKTSHKGLLFIYGREAFPGLSSVLHWPGGGSGVTLGPGYDMGSRTASQISEHLRKAGVDKAMADKVAKAEGLKGEKARQFVKENPELIDMNDFQGSEFNLLNVIIPHYEKKVRERVTVDLLQYQFDALVCFAYNPGNRLSDVTRLINQGETAKAMQVIKAVNTSGGKPLPGLSKRRELEVALYLYGDYGALPNVS